MKLVVITENNVWQAVINSALINKILQFGTIIILLNTGLSLLKVFPWNNFDFLFLKNHFYNSKNSNGNLSVKMNMRSGKIFNKAKKDSNE